MFERARFYVELIERKKFPSVLGHEFNRIQNEVGSLVLEEKDQIEASKARLEYFVVVRVPIVSRGVLLLLIEKLNVGLGELVTYTE